MRKKMNRSTDILVQIQQIRLDRKKPKTPVILKTFNLNENQKSALSVARWRKTPTITLKKTGSRNSFAFIFSIGFHAILAILIGVFCIAERMVNEDNVLRLEFFVIKPRPPHVHPPRLSRLPKFPHPQAVRIQQEPVTTPTDSLKTQNTIKLLDSDVSIVEISENSTVNRAKSFEIRRDVSFPSDQEILKLTPILIIEKLISPNTSFDELTQTEPDAEHGLIDPLDLVGTETMPLQTTPILKPAYPKMAKLLKKEGTVILRANIDTDGIPKEITVLTKLGYGLEEAAVETLKKSRYIPAKKNGTAIARLVEIQFDFKIQE